MSAPNLTALAFGAGAAVFAVALLAAGMDALAGRAARRRARSAGLGPEHRALALRHGRLAIDHPPRTARRG